MRSLESKKENIISYWVSLQNSRTKFLRGWGGDGGAPSGSTTVCPPTKPNSEAKLHYYLAVKKEDVSIRAAIKFEFQS